MKYVVFVSCIVATTALFVWQGRADAPSGRYDTSVSGVVLDTKTRLMWQQTLQTGMNRQAAQSYCAGLSGGGWRLPTVHELMTLVDDTSANQIKIDQTFFPGVTMASAIAWSSTPVSGDPTSVWAVSFYFAKIIEAGVNATTPRTRCVRLADVQ